MPKKILQLVGDFAEDYEVRSGQMLVPDSPPPSETPCRGECSFHTVISDAWPGDNRQKVG